MTRFFILPIALFLITLDRAPAQDRVLKLRWYGQSFFQLETSLGKKIVLDPHAIPEFGRNIVPADIVLLTHLHNDHTQLGAIEDPKAARIFYGLEETRKGRPPEWKKHDEKVGQIRIRTVGLYHDAQDGMARGKNSAWIVEVDGLVVCHLGDLGHELTPAQLKLIGPVDVLLVPIGGVYTLNGGQAQRVVGQIKPRLFVLPMHYGVPGYEDLLPADEFLDGLTNVKKMTHTNELVIPADLKADAPTVVLLGWKVEGKEKK